MKKVKLSLTLFFSIIILFFVGISNTVAQASFVDANTAKTKLTTEIEALSKKVNLEYPGAEKELDYYDIARLYYFAAVLNTLQQGGEVPFAIKINLSDPFSTVSIKGLNAKFPTAPPADQKLIFESSQVDDEVRYVLLKSASRILAN